MAEEEKNRIEEQRKQIGEEGLAQKAARLQEAMDFNEVGNHLTCELFEKGSTSFKSHQVSYSRVRDAVHERSNKSFVLRNSVPTDRQTNIEFIL